MSAAGVGAAGASAAGVLPRAPARLTGLDALRALAITMVVGWHFTPAELLDEPVLTRLHLLARGVDLFFVLSGFLIGGIALREVAPAPRMGAAIARFWRRRWYRTLPAYLVTIALYVVTLAFPHRADTTGFPWLYLVFAQTYVLGLPQVFGHSWTLAVEEHFYLALPLCVALGAALCGRATRRTAPAAALVVGALGATLAGSRIIAVARGYEVNDALSHLRADGLVAGVLLACAAHASPAPFAWVRRHAGLARLGTVGLLVGAMGLDLRASPFAQTALAAAFAAIVALGAAADPAIARIGAAPAIAWIGRLSYAIYLVHQLANRSVQMVLFGGGLAGPVDAALHIGIALGLSVAAAWVMHVSVERPMLQLRDRRAPPLRTPESFR